MAKNCKKGTACGNTCISSTKVCKSSSKSTGTIAMPPESNSVKRKIPKGKAYKSTKSSPQKRKKPTLSVGSTFNKVRKSQPGATPVLPIQRERKPKTKTTPTFKAQEKETMDTIRKLDRDLDTGNYVPIPRIRDAMPGYSRKDLDDTLFRLQRQNKIELSSLLEGGSYSQEDFDKGILNSYGTSNLFFVVLTETDEDRRRSMLI